MKIKEVINLVYQDLFEDYSELEDPEAMEDLDQIKKVKTLSELREFLQNRGFENPDESILNLIVQE